MISQKKTIQNTPSLNAAKVVLQIFMVQYFRRRNDKLNDIAISPSFLTAVSAENDVFRNVVLCWLTNGYHSYRRCGGCKLLRRVGNFHQQTWWNKHLHVSFCYFWFKVRLIMTVSVREYKLCKAWKLLPFSLQFGWKVTFRKNLLPSALVSVK